MPGDLFVIDPDGTEVVADRLAEFAARLRRELDQPLHAIDLNAALLLRDLCEAWPLTADQRTRVLGNTQDTVALEDRVVE